MALLPLDGRGGGAAPSPSGAGGGTPLPPLGGCGGAEGLPSGAGGGGPPLPSVPRGQLSPASYTTPASAPHCWSATGALVHPVGACAKASQIQDLWSPLSTPATSRGAERSGAPLATGLPLPNPAGGCLCGVLPPTNTPPASQAAAPPHLKEAGLLRCRVDVCAAGGHGLARLAALPCAAQLPRLHKRLAVA